jgi:hypothetical protein
MNKDNTETKRKRIVSSEKSVKSHRGEHTIRLFFEGSYEQLVNSSENFRAYIDKYFSQHPEVFPLGFEKGYKFHDKIVSKKVKGLIIRRIRLKDGSVYQLVPSSIMPYLTGQTDQVSKGLLLRHWGVPYEIIALLLGRNATYWENNEESLARMSLIGSISKSNSIPENLAADEKITYWNGKEAYIALTSAQEVVLGAELSMKEDTEGLQQAYGIFQTEALACEPNYKPISVNLDGWKATNESWRNLFPSITIVLCFLHAFIKIRNVGKSLKEKFYEIGTQIWDVYRQKTKEDFENSIAALLVWAESHVLDNQGVKAKIIDLCGKVSKFAVAYNYPQCYRTSNQIDRPMNLLERYLYQIRYFHGNRDSGNNKIRAWAMIYNFMPFTGRVQKRTEKPKKQSRFEEFNGFVYHKNWLQNLLIAGSMNASRTRHRIC